MNTASHHFIPRKRGHLFSRIFSHTIPGAAALTSSIVFGVWTLYVRPAAPHIAEALVEAPRAGPAAVASNPYGALSDPRVLQARALVDLMQSFPIVASVEPAPPAPSAGAAGPEKIVPMPVPAPARLAEGIPLPVPRPPGFGSLENPAPPAVTGRRFAQQNRKPASPAASPDNRSFFEKLFGTGQPSGPVLAYAAPETGVVSSLRNMTSNPAGRYDRWTAVYDIAAHTVYMPDGKRLEAHSGLGSRLDDPRYVSERMRGATPPNVYELQPREQLFHGVPALRLIPVGNGELYGRTGLLAHTYMLGPNGDSNGCVSFKDYNAFLQAFRNGEIKRLAVVARSN